LYLWESPSFRLIRPYLQRGGLDVQPGFSSATLYITLSALFFLIVISLLRNKARSAKKLSSEVQGKDR